jgi:23S rRNA (cytidine2498-2'-O)-methyltransferase
VNTENQSIENQLIVTAHAEFMHAAIAELQQFDAGVQQLTEFTAGICLCATTDAAQVMRRAAAKRPIFVRHLAPVQATIPLTNTEQDIGRLAVCVASLPSFRLLERGSYFSVQSRLIQTDKSQGERPYSGGRLNQALAEAFTEETGAVESVKKPRIVVSIFCTSQQGYPGISTVEENLSSWPGGARRYAQTSEQISRAEFKLLEAIESFGIYLPSDGQALDLGAAPGGWTRLLLDQGLSVVAVDPAQLDPRVAKRKHLEHYRGYAEDYLTTASKQNRQFDVIVNDMRMDARDAARLLGRAARCLRKEGVVISTLKLPHATPTIDPLAMLKQALSIFSQHFEGVQARQLSHNRQEVTVVAFQPRKWAEKRFASSGS